VSPLTVQRAILSRPYHQSKGCERKSGKQNVKNDENLNSPVE
jgi:hypothetical protein